MSHYQILDEDGRKCWRVVVTKGGRRTMKEVTRREEARKLDRALRKELRRHVLIAWAVLSVALVANAQDAVAPLTDTPTQIETPSPTETPTALACASEVTASRQQRNAQFAERQRLIEQSIYRLQGRLQELQELQDAK